MATVYYRVNKIEHESGVSFCMNSEIWYALTGGNSSYPQAEDSTPPEVINIDVCRLAAIFIDLGILTYYDVPERYHEGIDHIANYTERLSSISKELDDDREMTKRLRLDLYHAFDNKLNNIPYKVS